ncbi:carbonic anhydrase family protein [uncultured Psychroserpens sp.]|uniref:carbonic anhydrase family protein n=1 Tax=uncultured Psychroserpens sp. TaxID=255436 RepID=UPI00260BA990|nr:carbonic anhydrase family protein [uncultured Psychroserpens sp.]
MKNTAITKEVQLALTPKSVLEDLLEGNNRFVSGNTQATDNEALVNQTTTGQYPKAVVLSCIDSRVPVETVLDQAIGDIFVARVAGNFENTDILGSLEYSCNVAGSKLILVLGHESCGAVKAACDGVELGNITAMLSNILPAVKKASDEFDGELTSANKEFVAKTVAYNVQLTMDRIRERSKILSEMEDNGEIKIVGGVYSLHSGKVEML